MICVNTADDFQAALDSASPGDIIQLAPGEYRVKAVVSTPGLTLAGAGADRTRIIWDDYAKKLDDHGVEYNTFRTWTLAVCADGVSMRDLSVVNSALRPEEKGQEVALTVYGDSFAMERCRLTSTQDTLFLGPLPADLIQRYDGFLPDHLRRDKPCAQRFTACLIGGRGRRSLRTVRSAPCGTPAMWATPPPPPTPWNRQRASPSGAAASRRRRG